MAKQTTSNTRKKSNNKKTSNTQKTKRNTNSKKVASKVKEEEFYDPFFDESSKEIVLWTSILLCVLLFISNIGIGGSVGNYVADLLFGVFGIVQYALPFLIAFAAFFIISNYGNKVAIAKVAAGFVLTIFISVFVELIIHGENVLGAYDAYEFSKENHNGGGLIGGAIVLLAFDSFGLFGAYLIDLIVMILSTIIIIERFAFGRVQRSSQYHADLAAAKRRERRERQLLEREANQTRFNSDRQAIKDKIEQERLLQEAEANNTSGARRDRRRTGVTTDTVINPEISSCHANDGVNEIRFNIGETEDSVEVTETKRHRLKSNKKAEKSLHSFAEKPAANAAETTIENNANITREINEPKINSPIINAASTDSSEKTVSTNKLMEENLAKANNEPETTRHAKPSVTSTKEMETESENLKAKLESDKKKTKKAYVKPSPGLLEDAKSTGGDSQEYLRNMANKLQQTLRNFGVEAEVKEVTRGPSVTQYKIQIDQGTKVSKVINLTDDIKLNMAVTDVRIEAPIPGEPYIGIEVPNKEKTMVGFKELVTSKAFKDAKSKISFCVGKDISGKVIVGNIEKMPHVLIAGATGSGKSVCINTIIMSILYNATPDEVKMIMVDPKMVELSGYNGIPHLLIPVVTDAKKAAGALFWAVNEMTERYELLALAGSKNIESFNEKIDKGLLDMDYIEQQLMTYPADKQNKYRPRLQERMYQLVIILDELADLMMVAAADVEDSIVRLAQLARAAGIHLVIATQRPTANVITGLIKANVPSRIAFKVSSGIDSRVILDANGAEELLGNGDMLYAPQYLTKPVRVQGAFVTENEVSRVCDFLRNNNSVEDFKHSEIEEQIAKTEASSKAVSISMEPDNSRDNLFIEAGRLVIDSQKGSIGYLQRNFRIGFNRAARIMDQLAEAGVVGPEVGTKPREIRMTMAEFEDYISQM